MRILLVLEASLGGTARHILDLADGLLARHHEVHFIYSPLREDRSFAFGLERLRETHADFHCGSVPMTREVTISDLGCYFRILNYVHTHGPFHVIHAHSTKAGFLTRLLLRRQGARLVYTPHALMTLNPALKGFRRVAVCALETMLGHFCDAVVTVSENEYRCAVESGIDPRKLTVISNGVSQPNTSYSRSRDAIHRSLGLPPGVTCIGSIGRLVPQKQMGRLIDAFAVLKRRIQRSVCLVIVGWGHLEAELRHKVAALGLTDCVRFLGEADGPAHIPAFDVLALTSGYESFGYVFLEALAAGVPVVTTRVGAADDLVEEGVTGYIADPWDASVFASYLQLLAENDVIRSSMAAAARQRAAQFSADRMVDATLDLYNRILQRARASSAPALRRILPRNLP